MKLETSDDQNIALCAFDYALGRRSYITGFVVDWLIRHWTQLSATTQARIVAKTESAITRNMAGDNCDVQEWSRLLNHATRTT